MKRFLLIDDHVVVRSGIKLLLSTIYTDAIIDEAIDGESAKCQIQKNEYDLAMLDINMPDTDTFALMEYVKSNFAALKVLVFSMSPENIYALRFIKAGAKGFISKDAPLEELRHAVEQVLNGKKYVSEEMLSILAEGNSNVVNGNPFNKLSAREFEIVSMLLTGRPLSKIADDLQLGISTVGTHKGRIFNKLNVTNLIELKELSSTHHL